MPVYENYNDLYVFFTVAEQQSFTKAAKQIGLSQSALSYRIKQLETRLDLQLFARTTRSLALTRAGEQLFHTVAKSFGDIDTELAMLNALKDNPAGTVRIVSSQYGINKVLIPKLAKFPQLYPEIRLELITDEGLNDIISEHFDAGVRWGYALAEGMVAVRISGDEEMALVGSPHYFNRHGVPKNIDDLAQHNCLAYQFQAGGIYEWDLRQNGNAVKFKPQGQWLFSSDDSIIAAAKQGLGVAYVPLGLVQEDIAGGGLVHILQDASHTFTGFHLYYPHRNISPALRCVVERLREG